MSAPICHAQTTVRLFGGSPEDYVAIHEWLDGTKELYGDFRHRAMRHHTHGVAEAERIFGHSVKNSEGEEIPVRYIAEQHIREDCDGRLPTVQDWLQNLTPKPWMNRKMKIEAGGDTRQV